MKKSLSALFVAVCVAVGGQSLAANPDLDTNSITSGSAPPAPLPVSNIAPHLDAMLRYEKFLAKFKDIYAQAIRRLEDRRLDLEREKQELMQRRFYDAKDAAETCFAVDKIETSYSHRINKLDELWHAEDAIVKGVNGIADLSGGYETLLLLIEQMHAPNERTIALRLATVERDGIVARLRQVLEPIQNHWRNKFQSDEARSDDRDLYEEATKAMSDLLQDLTH